MTDPHAAPQSTEGAAYADRLERLETVWWKRALDVQRPYRWNLRRLDPGFTLDIGCGLGRNLSHLDGNGVGVDHNPDSVAIARSRGSPCSRPTSSRRRSTRSRAASTLCCARTWWSTCPLPTRSSCFALSSAG